ncbi:MAG: periplasmic heavy metal sensor [Deltaproteobacteria bacterium]|nr:periplasmic heavy metal sensor [Deltaproteobacteria bacterium]
MKRDWLLYLVIFSLALNVGTIATFVYLRYLDKTAQAAREGLPPLPPRELWSRLNLNAEQQATLKGLWPEHSRRVRGLRLELAQKRRELLGLIKKNSSGWPAIQGKIKEISLLQGSLEEEVTDFFLQFQKHLNPEQKEAFLALLERRLTPFMGGRRGLGRERGHLWPGRGHGPPLDRPMHLRQGPPQETPGASPKPND